MIEQVKAAYTQYRWLRLASCVGLLVCGVLLYAVSDGFPPWAWTFLLHTLPQLHALWSVQRLAMLPALVGLVLLSLSLLVLWVTLVTIAIKMAIYAFSEAQQQQRFAQDLQEAEYMSEQMAASEEQQEALQEMSPWQPMYAVANGTRQTRSLAEVSAGYRIAAPPRKARLEAQPVFAQPAPPPLPMREQLRIVPRREAQQEEHEQDIAEHNTVQDYSTSPELDIEEAEATLRLISGISLDPGLARKDAPNEDSLIAFQCTRPTITGPQPVGLFVVADGMGGHANGQEASRLAIQTISDIVVPALLSSMNEEEIFRDLLKDGVHRANLAVYQRNRQQEHMMGTTMTAALVIGAKAYIANVGDSRTYLYRESEGLAAVTRDHSLVATLLESGVISAEEVYTHPKRNQIYRCLGEHATVQIDTFEVALQHGDSLLLCSDGLWEMVRDQDIEKIIKFSTPHASQIGTTLVQAALNRGGADNIGIVVVCVSAME